MTERTPVGSSLDRVPGADSVRRIAWLTPAIGLAAGIAAVLARRWDWAEGLVFGSALAWLNFRWLRRGVEALAAASVAQEGFQKPQVPVWTYLAAAFRYGLIALALYVIFTYLHVPLLSLVVGLCALGAATIFASLWEVIHPAN
jgi:small-conductance mechanosensitive channel